MQTMSQSLPKTTANNVRPINLIPNPNYPNLPPSNNSPHSPSHQQYRIPANLDNEPNHKTEPDCLLQRNSYSIHLVNSLKQRIKASTLIKRMYASRGYQTENTSVFSASPSQYTFEARQSQQLIGTLTLTIDTHDRLLADTLYQTELDQFRQQGRRLCEVSKLAFDSESGSKEIFASMFHIAYIFARCMHGVDDAFIEINPRHVPFYKRMLGFRQIGELRVCPRVNAPAMLLHLDLEYMGKQIITLAGQLGHKGRSIYPYFLTQHKEKEIIRHIQIRQMNFNPLTTSKTRSRIAIADSVTCLTV